jgi:hypothetical protein
MSQEQHLHSAGGSDFKNGSGATSAHSVHSAGVSDFYIIGQEQHLHSAGGSDFKNGSGATSAQCWLVGFYKWVRSQEQHLHGEAVGRIL